eukprot:1481600-Pyramimonas_sp.AAC.1
MSRRPAAGKTPRRHCRCKYANRNLAIPLSERGREAGTARRRGQTRAIAVPAKVHMPSAMDMSSSP